MGKGFNNYMTKKFFHPSSKDNLKRVWMAEQKSIFEKKKQDDMLTQYQKEQDQLSNRALLGDEKAKMGLSFLYDAPPGMKRKEKEDEEEVKFEWQRKFNAPRESYAKGDDEIRDQPFGIEVRNVRCIKCRQWGHVNTDKICPFFGQNLTAEPPKPENSTSSLIDSLKNDGFSMKKSIKGRFMDEDHSHPMVNAEESSADPEVKFLQSLTSKQKKKLLKKLNKLQGDPDSLTTIKKHKKSKKKHKKKDKDSSEDEGEGDDRKRTSHREEKNSDVRRNSIDRHSQNKHSERGRSSSPQRYNNSRRSPLYERYTRTEDRFSPLNSRNSIRSRDTNGQPDDRKSRSHRRSRSYERKSRSNERKNRSHRRSRSDERKSRSDERKSRSDERKSRSDRKSRSNDRKMRSARRSRSVDRKTWSDRRSSSDEKKKSNRRSMSHERMRSNRRSSS